jgi:Tfp pilus assembly protein PilO
MLTSPAIKTISPPIQKERNNLFEIILLAVVIIVFSWFALKPKVIALATQKQELKTLETQASMIDQKNKDLGMLIQKMESSKLELAVLDEALPMQSRTTSLMLLVDSLAKTNGLSVSAVSLDGSESAKSIVAANKPALEDPYKIERKLNTETILVTSSGTLDQFMGFLNAIENSTRLLDVQTIDIATNEDNILSYKVKVRGYTFTP